MHVSCAKCQSAVFYFCIQDEGQERYGYKSDYYVQNPFSKQPGKWNFLLFFFSFFGTLVTQALFWWINHTEKFHFLLFFNAFLRIQCTQTDLAFYQQSFLIVLHSGCMCWGRLADKRGEEIEFNGNNKNRRLAEEVAGHQRITFVICSAIKIHLQMCWEKVERLCEASKKNGGYQAFQRHPLSRREQRKAPAVRIQCFLHQ